MPPSFKWSAGIAGVMSLAVVFLIGWHPPERILRVDTTLIDPNYTGSLTRVAVIGDLHFNSQDDVAAAAPLFDAVAAAAPQAIFFVGDYIGRLRGFEIPHAEVVAALGRYLEIAPVYAVLGNHENVTGPFWWRQAFDDSRIELIDNRVIANDKFCVRGYGDFHTQQWQRTPLPAGCAGKTLTITHDPMGLVFQTGELETPSFAGHTHCGQLRLPLIGALYVPTDAPRSMHCGDYELGKPGLTTGGIGTTAIPLRWGPGAERRWELVTLN